MSAQPSSFPPATALAGIFLFGFENGSHCTSISPAREVVKYFHPEGSESAWTDYPAGRVDALKGREGLYHSRDELVRRAGFFLAAVILSRLQFGRGVVRMPGGEVRWDCAYFQVPD